MTRVKNSKKFKKIKNSKKPEINTWHWL